MYTYVKAIGISRAIGSQWEDISIGNTRVDTIFATYSNIVLELSNPILPTNVYVDLNDLRVEFSVYTGTLSVLLTAMGDRVLQTIPTWPNKSIRFCRYSDAYRSGYAINLGLIGQPNIAMTPKSALVDLIISRPNYTTNMELLNSHCLVTVNGLLHQTTMDGARWLDRGGRHTPWPAG